MKKTSPSMSERGLASGQARDKLHLALSNSPFAELERAFLDFERDRLRSASTQRERLEVRRRTAEDILLGAYGRPCTWTEFSRALQRMKRLGFSDISKRVEMACFFALSVKRFPEQKRSAQRALREAERRLRSVRKGHYLREEGMEAIKRTRDMTGWKPEVSFTARRRSARPPP